MIKIRKAQAGDFNQVLKLLEQLNPDDPKSLGTHEAVYNRIINTRGLDIIIASKSNEIIGCIYLNIIPNLTRGARPYALIENVVTDQNHRRQGIGKKMMKNVIDRAWREDCYKIMLLTGRCDKSTHSFYRSCGFRADQKQAYIIRSDV